MEEKLLAQLEEKNEWISQLETSLAETESELIDLQDRVQDLECMLEEMRASTSYRVALQFARAGAPLAPPGTVRRRFLRLGARGLRSVPKLRNRQWVVHKVKMALNHCRGSLGLVLSASADDYTSALRVSRSSLRWMSRSSSRYLTTGAKRLPVSSPFCNSRMDQPTRLS